MSKPSDQETPQEVHLADEEENSEFEGIDYSEQHNVSEIHGSILREKVDPEEGREPMPLWLIGIIGCLLFGGGIYLGAFSGGFDPTVYDERSGGFALGGGGAAGAGAAGEAAAAEAASPEALMARTLKLGKRVYTANCASCHQATGMGLAGQYPPLAGSNWISKHPRILIAIVLNGAQGEMTVNGNVYNNVMTAWGPNLSDKQIASVLTFVRQEWGNAQPPITVEEVAAVREELKDRSAAWTEPELLALSTEPILAGTATEEPAPGEQTVEGGG